MYHALGAGSIARLVGQQSSTLPMYYGCFPSSRKYYFKFAILTDNTHHGVVSRDCTKFIGLYAPCHMKHLLPQHNAAGILNLKSHAAKTLSDMSV